MSLANAQTYITAAVTAIGSGDYATAETKVLQAMAIWVTYTLIGILLPKSY